MRTTPFTAVKSPTNTVFPKLGSPTTLFTATARTVLFAPGVGLNAATGLKATSAAPAGWSLKSIVIATVLALGLISAPPVALVRPSRMTSFNSTKPSARMLIEITLSVRSLVAHETVLLVEANV
ncbi:hypothetical protein LBMAG56_02480 [Verrucomicrobiota bacterium]|nr:hypothetical protein LBMAG56_02480 [Verrucomicrobiota bacterium]